MMKNDNNTVIPVCEKIFTIKDMETFTNPDSPNKSLS